MKSKNNFTVRTEALVGADQGASAFLSRPSLLGGFFTIIGVV
ncbi:hypothetical protein [Neobacillus vireti]